MYCDGASEPAKAWRCKDPLKCGAAAADPTGPRVTGLDAAATTAAQDPWAAKLKTAAVTDAWEPLEQTALTGKLFLERPDTQAAQKGANPTTAPTKAMDWAATTAADATTTYEFAPAALALDADRLWKCVGDKAACATVQPSADTDGKAWALTTLKGAAFTDAEALAQQPAVVECFPWADGYPVQQGDTVCDPLAPSKRAWTCLDPLLCQGKPELQDAARLAAVWSLATEGSRADASGAVTRGLLLRFKELPAAPKEEGAPVQCADWDDRQGTADLGEALTWCDRGRVFRCVEAPVVVSTPATTVGINGATQTAPASVVSTRACCSGTDRPAAGAKLGCWRQARQRGTVAKKSAAEADARWGPAPAAAKCSANETFGAKGAQAGTAPAGSATAPAWSAAATAGKALKYGALELKDGAACAEDAVWQARLASASVTPRARLPEARADWPWHVRVADDSLPRGDGKDTLGQLLAGIGYRDAEGRAQLLNVIGWFPGICGDRAKADASTRRDVLCRADVAAALTFALAGEPDQAAWARARAAAPDTAALDADLQWWQTAFATPADAACHAAAKAGVTRPECARRASGVVATRGSLVQSTTAAYYARGAGPLPLVGAADYVAFSKAATGSESAFADAPEDVLTWGPAVGTWQGEAVGALPIAVALWRYVTPAHAWLPSVHEVATGMWQPRAHETAAGLKGKGDYCTAAALVVAMRALAAPADPNASAWAAVVAAGGPGRHAGVAGGSLGAAHRSLRAALGLGEPAYAAASSTGKGYDWSCASTPAWPEPAAGDTAARQAIWLVPGANGACTLAEQRPADAATKGYLSVFAEGDVARCWQDADPAQAARTVKERREQNADGRRSCQLWSATDRTPWEACPTTPAGGKPGADCTACTKLPAAACDAACEKDAAATKHALWRCQRPADCMLAEPGSAAEAAKAPADRAWAADAAALTAGAAAGAEYKVAAPALGKSVKPVKCVDFARALAEKEAPAMLERLAAPDALAADPKLAAAGKEMLYVCAKGRAYQCKAPAVGARPAAFVPAAGALDATAAYLPAGAQEPRRCLDGAGAAASAPGTVAGEALWELVKGAVGELEPAHHERWPDCLRSAAPLQHGDPKAAEFA